MTDAHDAVRAALSGRDADETIVIDLSDVCDDHETFMDVGVAFAHGYASRTHGLTNIEYGNRRVTFEPIAESSSEREFVAGDSRGEA